jgi:lysophosphatidylcholine acyltransferase/lyso-PAF acetyltransferase
MAPSKVAPTNGFFEGSAKALEKGGASRSPLGTPPEIPIESTIDPFTAQTVHVNGLYELIKTILMLPVFLLRFVFILVCLFLGYSWALIVLTGVKDKTQPFPKWRGILLYFTRFCARGVLFGLGYHWIPTKGSLAPREIAPVVVANHMSYTDPVFMFFRLLPAIVSAKQHESMPLIGTIIKAMQVRALLSVQVQ